MTPVKRLPFWGEPPEIYLQIRESVSLSLSNRLDIRIQTHLARYDFYMIPLSSYMFLAMPKHQTVDHGSAWIGHRAKSVIINDEDGKPVDLSKQFGKAPVVLVFYRAIW